MTLRFLTAGESHGPALTVILDGFPAGVPLNEEMLRHDLARRQKGAGAGPRMKLETDRAQILGGVMAGETTGAPLALSIRNADHSRWVDKEIPAFTNPRPGHADLAGLVKYGHTDIRPVLERASARETAARVAMGAVCRAFLGELGIRVEGWVRAIGTVEANLADIPLTERYRLSQSSEVACPSVPSAEAMTAAIREATLAKQTLGGILEVAAFGVPAGLGSCAQWDRRLEARLGAALLSIQAIKGVEIGEAFANARVPGTEAHDPILLEGNRLVRASNRAGGIEGGMSNGEPILIRAAMKPIATTLTPQPTVNLATGNAEPTNYERSDFCPVPRAVVILEAMTLFVLADALLEKTGGDSLAEIRPRVAALRQLTLAELMLDPNPKAFWKGGEA